MSATNTGSMTNRTWYWVTSAIEKIGDVIKGSILILGILAANVADVAFGTIAIGVLFGGTNTASIYGFSWLSNWVFGGLISTASSAFQILLWSVIQRRGITFGQVIRWRIPNEIKSLVIVTGIMWFIDTLIDVSPIALMIQNSPFQSITWLFHLLVVFVGVLVFFLCGFAEVATSNIRSALGVSGAPAPASRPTQTQTTSTNVPAPENAPMQAQSGRPLYNEPTYHPAGEGNNPQAQGKSSEQRPYGQRTANGKGFHNNK